MRSAIKLFSAIHLICVAALPAAAAAPPSASCTLISKSFADVLPGSVKTIPVGAHTRMVPVGNFAEMSVGIDASIDSGDATTLKTMLGDCRGQAARRLHPG